MHTSGVRGKPIFQLTGTLESHGAFAIFKSSLATHRQKSPLCDTDFQVRLFVSCDDLGPNTDFSQFGATRTP